MVEFPYGKCEKCQGPLDIHYECPKCDKPEDINLRVLDFFKVAAYIAAQEGYNNDRNSLDSWHRKVLENFEFRNDTCINHFLNFIEEDKIETELDQFDKGLVKYFGFKAEDTDYSGDSMLLWISW